MARIQCMACMEFFDTVAQSGVCPHPQALRKETSAMAPGPQKMMRVVLANGLWLDLGPLPPDFNFQGAMNSIRLAGAWLSDNLFIEKPQIGCVLCWDVGTKPPTIERSNWANDTGETKQ